MQGVKKGEVLSAEALIPLKKGHTISKGLAKNIVLFSLAADTDISEETYLEDKSYWLLSGRATVAGYELKSGEIVLIPRGTLLGLSSASGAYLMEGTWEEENVMKLEKGKVLALKDQIDFVEGGISNKDLAKGEGMKFGLLAFDKGQGLTPHSAPGDAMLTALEGRAHVTMGDIEADIEAGESIVLEKNVPHSVLALEPFKMSILMVVD